jgi:hypothetical protein
MQKATPLRVVRYEDPTLKAKSPNVTKSPNVLPQEPLSAESLAVFCLACHSLLHLVLIHVGFEAFVACIAGLVCCRMYFGPAAVPSDVILSWYLWTVYQSIVSPYSHAIADYACDIAAIAAVYVAQHVPVVGLVLVLIPHELSQTASTWFIRAAVYAVAVRLSNADRPEFTPQFLLVLFVSRYPSLVIAVSRLALPFAADLVAKRFHMPAGLLPT